MYILILFKNGDPSLSKIVTYYERVDDAMFYKYPYDDALHSLNLNDYDSFYVRSLPHVLATTDDTDISLLIDEIVEINKKNGIPQSVYVTEECSELIKTFTKDMRKKGSTDDIIEEACDVLAAVFVLLKVLGMSREQVRSNIIVKYRRQIDRYYDHWEL